MTVRLELQGDTLQDIIDQMALFLKTTAPYPEPPQDTGGHPSDHGGDLYGKRRNRTPKAPKAPPEPTVVDDVDDANMIPVEVLEETDVTPEAEKAVELLKLKNEQLDRLRDLFNAGKGTFVRELLAKYGEGAKVFPEVEARHFPQIKADIDRELN